MTDREDAAWQFADEPHLFACGEPPLIGERVWRGDGVECIVTKDGPVPVRQSVDVPGPTLLDRALLVLMCGDCLLPRFASRHRRKGCSSRVKDAFQ